MEKNHRRSLNRCRKRRSIIFLVVKHSGLLFGGKWIDRISGLVCCRKTFSNENHLLLCSTNSSQSARPVAPFESRNPATEPTGRLLQIRFFYHMQGQMMGELVVRLVENTADSRTVDLWRSRKKRDQWMRAVVSLPQNISTWSVFLHDNILIFPIFTPLFIIILSTFFKFSFLESILLFLWLKITLACTWYFLVSFLIIYRDHQHRLGNTTTRVSVDWIDFTFAGTPSSLLDAGESTTAAMSPSTTSP